MNVMDIKLKDLDEYHIVRMSLSDYLSQMERDRSIQAKKYISNNAYLSSQIGKANNIFLRCQLKVTILHGATAGESGYLYSKLIYPNQNEPFWEIDNGWKEFDLYHSSDNLKFDQNELKLILNKDDLDEIDILTRSLRNYAADAKSFAEQQLTRYGCSDNCIYTVCHKTNEILNRIQPQVKIKNGKFKNATGTLHNKFRRSGDTFTWIVSTKDGITLYLTPDEFEII